MQNSENGNADQLYSSKDTIWFINHNFDYLIITQDFKQKYENKLHFCPLALWVVLAITAICHS